MPKASPIQTTFSSGELSPFIQGRVDAERYKQGCDQVTNYIPTLQGPLVRRPGTKYIADVKDPSNTPVLIPFQFSQTQGYMLEFGNRYIRFYANEGQVVTSSNIFKVKGLDYLYNTFNFYGIRTVGNAFPDEIVTSSSVIAAGSIMELVTPYDQADLQNLKWAQKDDTIYLTNSRYPVYKLQRGGTSQWTLKQVQFQNGPHLPLNSYLTLGDSTRTFLYPQTSTGIGTYLTGPASFCSSVIDNGGGICRVITAGNHGFRSGDKVVINGVVGTVGSSVNNVVSPNNKTSWPITVVSATSFDCLNTSFSGSYTGSGVVYPALFQPNSTLGGFGINDVGRNVRLIQQGVAVWGYITSVTDPKQCAILPHDGTILTGTGFISIWQMGTWYNPILPQPNFPAAVSFHQDRLAFSGAPNFPQEVDLSSSGVYEDFSISNSSLIVADNNALQFNLNSSESNPTFWLKSSAQGLLAGTFSSEWLISPSSQAQALTPTNFNAAQTSFFGSMNADAVQAGNATLYIQRASRKIREMNYFFQVGTFRSTDLTELSEHISIPSVTKLSVQREPFPLVWGMRSDGALVSMTYNRDDQTIHAGWAKHFLGGQSDAAGTIPKVLSFATISASSAVFDQMWMVTKRFINGTSVVSIEAMVSPWNDGLPQEDAFYFDNGITYDAPVNISNIAIAGSVVVTAASHGFNNGSSVLITNVIGLNRQVLDINGNATIENLVNEKTFVVASTTVNSFYLQDFSGNFITGSSYNSIVINPVPLSASGYARKLVNGIQGLTWLKNEMVGVLADGGIHPPTQVNSAGFLALTAPAAKVQIGYDYFSDGKLLRPNAGSADGSAIGKTRRITRAAFLLHNSGDFNFGMAFNDLFPVKFPQANVQTAGTATPLWSGIYRDGLNAVYDFDGQVCFRQSKGLPGMVQSVTLMLEEFDV